MPAHHVKPRLHRLSFTDFALAVLAIILNIMFLVGSFLFLPGYSEHLYEVGVWLYIDASTVVSILSLKTVWDLWPRYHALSRDDGTRHECCETTMYAIAGILFAIGTWLFLPGYAEIGSAWNWNTVGAWMFIIGCLSFVAAGLNNALNIHHDSADDSNKFFQLTAYNLSVAALFSTMFGSVFFVVGSFFFRPAGALECEEGHVGLWCHSSTFSGAWCFIIGSCLFAIKTASGLLAAIVTHRVMRSLGEESSEDEDEEDYPEPKGSPAVLLRVAQEDP